MVMQIKLIVVVVVVVGQKCKLQRVTQNLRVFAYIARSCNSAAESTSLLSSVASLRTTTPGGEGGTLYTWKLRPKGVRFSGSRYMKEKGIHELTIWKGRKIYLLIISKRHTIFQVLFFNGWYMTGVPFLSQMVYKSVRGWTSGQSFLAWNFVEGFPSCFFFYTCENYLALTDCIFFKL